MQNKMKKINLKQTTQKIKGQIKQNENRRKKLVKSELN